MTVARLAWRHWLAVRIGVWLCALPVRLRTRSLHALLAEIEGARGRLAGVDVRDAVRIARRVSGFPVFRLPGFPRPCLRESLALFYVLAGDGQEPRFHIGVRQDGRTLSAHSWITWRGEALAPHEAKAFRTLYTYPDTGERGAHPVAG